MRVIQWQAFYGESTAEERLQSVEKRLCSTGRVLESANGSVVGSREGDQREMREYDLRRSTLPVENERLTFLSSCIYLYVRTVSEGPYILAR